MSGTLHMNYGPEMREAKRVPWEVRWCFRCRARLPHDAVLMEPTESSYYGPHWRVECEGCGGDHVHFPWCAPDGPTLVMAAEG